MRILVTNDDGVHAPGLKALAERLSRMGEVFVVAPAREQSASGHALTIQHPLRIAELAEKIWAVTGTPTDCVLLAVHALLGRKPDLIVSGINSGSNMGDDVTYSGTVSAAFEGTLLEIPSMAVSLAVDLDDRGPQTFETAAECAARVAGIVAERSLPPKTLLNVNVPRLPASEIRGYRLTRLGHRVFRDIIVAKTDPRGRPYYWVAGKPEWDQGEKTDITAIMEGYVSVTPLNMDMTDYKLLVDMEAWGVAE
jgi:5'-nucleotidase